MSLDCTVYVYFDDILSLNMKLYMHMLYMRWSIIAYTP